MKDCPKPLILEDTAFDSMSAFVSKLLFPVVFPNGGRSREDVRTQPKSRIEMRALAAISSRSPTVQQVCGVFRKNCWVLFQNIDSTTKLDSACTAKNYPFPVSTLEALAREAPR